MILKICHGNQKLIFRKSTGNKVWHTFRTPFHLSLLYNSKRKYPLLSLILRQATTHDGIFESLTRPMSTSFQFHWTSPMKCWFFGIPMTFNWTGFFFYRQTNVISMWSVLISGHPFRYMGTNFLKCSTKKDETFKY